MQSHKTGILMFFVGIYGHFRHFFMTDLPQNVTLLFTEPFYYIKMTFTIMLFSSYIFKPVIQTLS